MTDSFESLLNLVSAGEDLKADQMRSAISRIMTGGCDESQMAQFLTALATKGETVAEIAGAAAAMRSNMTPIISRHSELLDTCGTGGGGSTTFNISTTAALVIATQGMPVAKHGNRSVTSRSGSADVLAGLGVNIEASVPQVERCLNELGICFCFAPLMHPAMKNVSAVRRQLGIRTIFNLLGPLANPAGAQFQLLGVGRAETRQLIASALAKLGTKRSFVVCGHDGLGEVTLTGKTQGTEVTPLHEQEFSWVPEDFGIPRSPLDAIAIQTPSDSVAIVRRILDGDQGPARDIVILNAAAGLLVSGRSDNPRDAAKLAAEAIDSGGAANLLQRLVKLSHEPAC
jgi:anthranilate phosphoribosyltransferase